MVLYSAPKHVRNENYSTDNLKQGFKKNNHIPIHSVS